MIFKNLNETATKCNHLKIETDKGFIYATKFELTGDSEITREIQEEVQLLNQLKNEIVYNKLTDWSAIKIFLESKVEIM